jgi:hypothetical protein
MGLCVALAVALIQIGAALESRAHPLAGVSSTAFSHQYNGDTYPVPNYTENPVIVDPSTDGDIFSFRAPTGGGYYSANDWDVYHHEGFAFEFRLKVDDDFAEGTKGAFAVLFGDGTAGDIFSVGKSFTMVGNGAITVDTADNTDDFHVFRVEQDGGSPTPIKFYRDSVLLHTLPNGGNFATDLLIWGSAGGAFGGPTVHLDYFRWEVPEPGSACLIGFAAMALWLRRRR